jgi:hypothetical protein
MTNEEIESMKRERRREEGRKERDGGGRLEIIFKSYYPRIVKLVTCIKPQAKSVLQIQNMKIQREMHPGIQ